MSWVYIKSERYVWTVGHYAPDGSWHSDSDHDSSESAAKRCNYLNGAPVHEPAAEEWRMVP
jgi:hypothetical protein